MNLLELKNHTGTKYKATFKKNGNEYSQIIGDNEVFHLLEYAKKRDESITDSSWGMYLGDGSSIYWEVEELFTENEQIIDFLKDHHLISVEGLERYLGIPHKTITQAMAGTRQIPKKYHEEIIKHLRNYGWDDMF